MNSTVRLSIVSLFTYPSTGREGTGALLFSVYFSQHDGRSVPTRFTPHVIRIHIHIRIRIPVVALQEPSVSTIFILLYSPQVIRTRLLFVANFRFVFILFCRSLPYSSSRADPPPPISRRLSRGCTTRMGCRAGGGECSTTSPPEGSLTRRCRGCTTDRRCCRGKALIPC